MGARRLIPVRSRTPAEMAFAALREKSPGETECKGQGCGVVSVGMREGGGGRDRVGKAHGEG